MATKGRPAKRARTETTPRAALEAELRALAGPESFELDDALACVAHPEIPVRGKHGALVGLYIDAVLGRSVETGRLEVLVRLNNVPLLLAKPVSRLTCIKYECANYYTTLKEKETLPQLALDFLNVVQPTIQVTLAKHTDVDVTFDESIYTEKDTDEDYAPEDWEDEGAGRWHDNVFDDDHGKEAWEYYLAHHEDEDVDTATRAVWKKGLPPVASTSTTTTHE